MSSTQKKIALFIIMGVVASGFPLAAVCYSHCMPVEGKVGIAQVFYCPFIGHDYAPLGVFLPLFYFVATGFFLIAKNLFLPPGFAAILFRPPKASLK